jgi:hypothetical protein
MHMHAVEVPCGGQKPAQQLLGLCSAEGLHACISACISVKHPDSLK